MSRGIRHSPAATRTAHATLFTRVRNQPVQAVIPAVDTKEAPRQHAALEELAKLALHKGRHMTIPLAMPSQERLQMSGDDSVYGILLRIARTVDGGDSHEAIPPCKA